MYREQYREYAYWYISLERVKQAFKEKAIEIPGRRPRTDHCWQHLLHMLFQSVKLVFQENILYP